MRKDNSIYRPVIRVEGRILLVVGRPYFLMNLCHHLTLCFQQGVLPLQAFSVK